MVVYCATGHATAFDGRQPALMLCQSFHEMGAEGKVVYNTILQHYVKAAFLMKFSFCATYSTVGVIDVRSYLWTKIRE